jgi:hypothetical protein
MTRIAADKLGTILAELNGRDVRKMQKVLTAIQTGFKAHELSLNDATRQVVNALKKEAINAPGVAKNMQCFPWKVESKKRKRTEKL